MRETFTKRRKGGAMKRMIPWERRNRNAFDGEYGKGHQDGEYILLAFTATYPRGTIAWHDGHDNRIKRELRGRELQIYSHTDSCLHPRAAYI